MWSYAIHETRTGTPVTTVFPASCTWARKLVGTGTGSATFKLLDADTALPRDEVRGAFQATGKTLVVKWRQHVAYAGVITDTSYDRDSGTLTVNYNEFRSLLGKRMTGGVNGYGPGWDLDYADKSAAGAVRAILERAMLPSAEWDFPIDIPDDVAGSMSRHVDFFETLTIADLISEVEDLASCTVDFRPYLSSGALRWETRVMNDSRTYGVTDLPISPAESRVTGLTARLDGKKQVTGILAVGNGTGEDMVTAYAPTSGSGASQIPVRDEKRDAKDLKTASQIQAFATAEYEKWHVPREQLSFKVRLSDDMSPDMVQPGRLLRMDVRGDPWLPNGVREQRVVSLSGDMGMGVTPEVQSIE